MHPIEDILALKAAFGMAGAPSDVSMKTYYFIKSILPYLFLPLAPGVVQVELARLGFTNGPTGFLAFFMQIVFTLGIIVFLVRAIHRKNEAREFLRMSCVSKKVFIHGKWISVEQYLADRHNVVVSHGMTPEETEAWLRESEEYLREVDIPLESEALSNGPIRGQGVLVGK